MRRTYIYLPLALATVTLATGCKRKTAEAADTAQQLVVGTENVAIAHEGSVTNGPAISGSLDAELNATVRAQVAGSIVSTDADVGQTVRKGQLLGRIDASGLQDAYLSAKSASGVRSCPVCARALRCIQSSSRACNGYRSSRRSCR